MSLVKTLRADRSSGRFLTGCLSHVRLYSLHCLIRHAVNFSLPLGEHGSLTHGSVVDGKFEGFINSHHGTYYVEPVERYLGDKNVPFHSVIYREDDISEYYLNVYLKRTL